MDGSVLVLNLDYRALNVCSVERAVVLVFLQKAEIVESLPERYIRSPSRRMPRPSVVRLKRYIRVPYQKVILSRRNMFQRDQYTCQYCGATSDLTIDHVVPKSRGGTDSWNNLVTACNRCNNRKGDRTPEEANMSLNRQPYRPSRVMFFQEFMPHETWKPYLYMLD